jgi:hypothetical protein
LVFEHLALRCGNAHDYDERLTWRSLRFAALALIGGRDQSSHVNTQELTEIHQALAAVHDTVGTLTFPRCDQDDVFEAIDRVESELSSSHPNVHIIGTFLNSIARSLRAQPEAREACLRIEDVIERTGLPSTWQAGI